MIISYDTLAASVLVSLNEVGNYTLQQALILSARSARAKLLIQDAERNKLNPIYQQTITIKLEKSEVSDGCSDTGNCHLISTDRIPEPVRTKDRAPFSYVGSLNGKVAAIHTPIEMWDYNQYNKYTCDAIRYDYINGYLHVNDNTKIKYIAIKHAFVSPVNTASYCETSDICVSDSDEMVLPADMFNTIKKMLFEEYRPGIENPEVKIKEENGNQR